MDSEPDKELAQLLDSYAVADADQALLDRIVARAEATKIIAMPARLTWIKSAAMIAATAVLGFWFGNATLQTPTHYVQADENTSGSVNLDKVIIGPKTFNEVML